MVPQRAEVLKYEGRQRPLLEEWWVQKLQISGGKICPFEGWHSSMDCPNCRIALDEIYTAEGVVVDFCPRCKGTWYDHGELLFFSQRPRQLKSLLEESLLSPWPSQIR